MGGGTWSGSTAQAPRNSAQASTQSRENIRASGAVAVMVAGISLADQNSRQRGTSPQATGATVRRRAQPEADRNMTFLSVSLVWVDALAWGGRTAGGVGEDRAVRRFGRCAVGGGEWRGFHHHAGLGIAAYGFLMAQRLHSGCCRQNPVPRTARRAPGWGVRAPAIAGLEHGPGKNGC